MSSTWIQHVMTCCLSWGECFFVLRGDPCLGHTGMLVLMCLLLGHAAKLPYKQDFEQHYMISRKNMWRQLKINYMDVSENSGTPKSSNLIGYSIINHPFWGSPIFGNTHIGAVSHVTPLITTRRPRGVPPPLAASGCRRSGSYHSSDSSFLMLNRGFREKGQDEMGFCWIFVGVK